MERRVSRVIGNARRRAREPFGWRGTLPKVLTAFALLMLLAACQPTRRDNPVAEPLVHAPVHIAPAARRNPTAPVPAVAEPEPATLARLRARLQPLDCDGAATARWLHHFASPRARLGERLAAVLPQLDFVERQLAAQRLPAEFALIPWIESDYRADAVGRGGPLGMWQLMPGTARAHGAVIDTTRDMRLSVLESTRVATDHLRALSQRFGDWRLAAMAFNAGEARIARALANSNVAAVPHAVRPPGLAAITYQYVDKLQALSCLLAQPQRYAVELPEHALDTPLTIIAVPPDAYSLDAIAEALQVDRTLLQRLNGGLQHAVLPAGDARSILVPQPSPSAIATLAQVRETPPPIATHRVRSGDSLWLIARRYGLRIADLQRINGLSSKAVLRVGQVLRLAR